jgi:hypothetical protein
VTSTQAEGTAGYNDGGGGAQLSGLRALRILRPLKTIAKSEDLRVILNAITASFSMLMNILVVLTFFILVMAIAGTQLFKGQLLYRCINVISGRVSPYEFCP